MIYGTPEALDHLDVFFLSSRETISQSEIEPPTAPIGRLRPVFGSFSSSATFYRVDLQDGTCVAIHNDTSTNNWTEKWIEGEFPCRLIMH